MSKTALKESAFIAREDFQQLLDALKNRGYRLIGPIMRDNAIIYDELASVSDLPAGYTDQQSGGSYRLHQCADNQLFGYTLGPTSWKKFLYPTPACLWRAQRNGANSTFEVRPEESNESPMAFIGVRACELQAIAILDRVLGQGADPVYQKRREKLFIVAVNCGQPGGTCFCASMKAGPKAEAGFDLALTEVSESSHHYFVTEVGTEKGAEVLNDVPHRPATRTERQTAVQILSHAAEQMGRSLETKGLKQLLYDSYEHPAWDEAAARCLTCGNCTMVCPTCFCANIEDTTDLSGTVAERWRTWDSCFSLDHSYIFGGSVRPSAKARYRQWMMHKLATWIDQFGTMGCVGCGRCITWCPVGIDITEMARTIRGEAVPARRLKHERA